MGSLAWYLLGLITPVLCCGLLFGGAALVGWLARPRVLRDRLTDLADKLDPPKLVWHDHPAACMCDACMKAGAIDALLASCGIDPDTGRIW